MLNIKGIVTIGSTADCSTDGLAKRNAETYSLIRKGRDVPTHVRKLAEEAANRHGMTITNFIAEAILEYAERVDNGTAHRTDLPLDPADAAKNYEQRIEALEKRIGALKKKEASFEMERNRFEDANGTTSFAIDSDYDLVDRLRAQIFDIGPITNVNNSEELHALRLGAAEKIAQLTPENLRFRETLRESRQLDEKPSE